MERKCSIQGCDSKHYCHDFCVKHYGRWKKHGDPMSLKRQSNKGMPVTERFMLYVEKQDEGCWIWNGSFAGDRYGWFWDGSENIGAHRFSMREFNGVDVNGFQVRHTCDNPRCVNPSHLLLGSHQDNMDDKTDRKRQTRGREVNTAKITETQAIEITQSTKPAKAIAEEYGLHWSTVYRIRNGIYWKSAKHDLQANQRAERSGYGV